MVSNENNKKKRQRKKAQTLMIAFGLRVKTERNEEKCGLVLPEEWSGFILENIGSLSLQKVFTVSYSLFLLILVFYLQFLVAK